MRTGRVQTEATATGIITTAETVKHHKGKKHTVWEQIGYTSVRINDDGQKIADGLYGLPLYNELNK
jgi:hypothetical protein